MLQSLLDGILKATKRSNSIETLLQIKIFNQQVNNISAYGGVISINLLQLSRSEASSVFQSVLIHGGWFG